MDYFSNSVSIDILGDACSSDNTVPPMINEPATLQSQVQISTTEPPGSLVVYNMLNWLDIDVWNI